MNKAALLSMVTLTLAACAQPPTESPPYQIAVANPTPAVPDPAGGRCHRQDHRKQAPVTSGTGLSGYGQGCLSVRACSSRGGFSGFVHYECVEGLDTISASEISFGLGYERHFR